MIKTAKALGLAVPPSILLRADEVIEISARCMSGMGQNAKNGGFHAMSASLRIPEVRMGP